MRKICAYLVIAVLLTPQLLTLIALFPPPVYAVEPIITPTPPATYLNLEYQLDTHTFKIKLNKPLENADHVTYQLYYQTTADKLEGVKGEVAVGQTKDILSGTCSSGDCVTQTVSHGLLKATTSEYSAGIVRRFTIDKDGLQLGSEGKTQTLELEPDDENWLQKPEASQRDAVTSFAPAVVPTPTPTVTPTAVLSPSPTAIPSPTLQPTFKKKSKIVKNGRRYQHHSRQADPTEITTLRTATTSVYEVSPDSVGADSATITDPTLQTAVKHHQKVTRYDIALEPVHYATSGHYADIDNTIVVDEQDGYYFRNAANSYTFRAGQDLATGVSYTDDKGATCRFALDAVAGVTLNNITGVAQGNRLTYRNIYPDADLEFTLSATGLKTEIVAKSAAARKTELTFVVAGCDIGKFQPPTMTAGHKTVTLSTTTASDQQTTLIETDGKTQTLTEPVTRLILRPDYQQLGNTSGEVRIDPSIESPPQTTYVTSNVAGPHYQENNYAIGGVNGYENARAFFKFDMNSVHGVDIIGGKISLTQQQSSGDTYAKAQRITQAWSVTADFPGPAVSGDYGITGVAQLLDNSVTGRRDLNLSKSLLDDVINTGQGFAIGSSNNHGFTFCARNTGSNAALGGCNYPVYIGPHLIVYSLSDVPNPDHGNRPTTPRLIMPANGTIVKSGAPCDESVTPATGVCRQAVPVALVAGSGDPDGWGSGDILGITFSVSGANNGTTFFYGTGELTDYAFFNDGVTFWHAQAGDRTGRTSDWSPTFQFSIDTTPPTVPTLDALPAATKPVGLDNSVQITLTAPKTTDNVSEPTHISYRARYSTTSDFSHNVYYVPWQTDNPRFEIARTGADQIASTADDLDTSLTYYFQMTARDEASNISAWSQSTSISFDTVAPVVSNIEIGDARFSPTSTTSLGVNDSTEISFTYTEANPQAAQMVISRNGTTVRTITFDESGENDVSEKMLEYIWDGRDNNGIAVADGPYDVMIQVADRAGNVNTPVIDETIIVDNSAPGISLSSPADMDWASGSAMLVTGQAGAPHADNKLDTDVATVTLSVNSGAAQSVTLADLGFFSHSVTLATGRNTITLTSQDSVGNTNSKTITINRDTTAPEISQITPDQLINNRKPTITFTAIDPPIRRADPDPSGDYSQTSGLPLSGNSFHVWLTNDIQPDAIIELANAGLNLNPTLVSNLSCTAATGAHTSTYHTESTADRLTCTLAFGAELQPDATYTIHVATQDIAGNQATQTQTFTLDSHLYNHLDAVKAGAIYTTATPLFQGKASRNSALTITNQTLGRSRTVTLNPSLNGHGADPSGDPDRLIMTNFTVNCGDTADLDQNPATPAEELCTWSTRVMQKTARPESLGASTDALGDQDVANTTLITVTDAAGNTDMITLTYTVNLFAYDLQIATNVQYFSPNGDGRQDGVVFSQSAQNHVDDDHPADPLNPVSIATWKLLIKQTAATAGSLPTPQIVSTINGADFLPALIIFNGKNDSGNWLTDGTYIYELAVTTTDGATRIVPQPAISLFARTKLTDSVVITSPKTGAVTTNGVMVVQGQAPAAQPTDAYAGALLKGDIDVEICINTLTTPETASCDQTAIVQADAHGFFSSIVVLPRAGDATQTHHLITAFARDHFGNQTNPSPPVTVIVDVVDPFNHVKIIPALTGVSSAADYEKFLRGEISIDQIRSVMIAADVSQNTQAVQLEYAQYINTSEKREAERYNYIALINDQTEAQTALNPSSNPAIKHNHAVTLGGAYPDAPCTNASGCTWQYQLPIAPDAAGIYEIKLTGKKSTTLQSLTAGYKVDQTLPAAPIILSLEKWSGSPASAVSPVCQHGEACAEPATAGSAPQTLVGGAPHWLRLASFNGESYTNVTRLRLRGAGEPGTHLQISPESLGVSHQGTVLDLNGVTSLVVPDSGIWETELDLHKYIHSVRQTFVLTPTAFELDDDGHPFQSTAGPTQTINYDETLPQAVTISRAITAPDALDGWTRTGDLAVYTLTSDVSLSYADLTKEDTFVSLLTPVNSANTSWIGQLSVNRASEGFYDPVLRVVNYADNKQSYDAHDWEAIGLRDFRLYIDNTKPVVPSWNLWGGDGGRGAGAGKNDVFHGRLNEGYVTRASTITVSGKAEANQRAKLYINGAYSQTQLVSPGGCVATAGLDANIFTADGLIVKYAQRCDVSFDVSLSGTGKHPDSGEPQEGYFYELRAVDRAGNASSLSQPLYIYHDTQPPVAPEIMVEQDEIRIKAERFADVEVTMYAPDGKVTTSGRLKADKFGLTTGTIHQIYTDQWGSYRIQATSWDAPGNQSPTRQKVMERIEPTPMPGPSATPAPQPVTTVRKTTTVVTYQTVQTQQVQGAKTSNQSKSGSTPTQSGSTQKPATQSKPASQPGCVNTWKVWESTSCAYQAAARAVTATVNAVSSAVTYVANKVVDVAQWVRNEIKHATTQVVTFVTQTVPQAVTHAAQTVENAVVSAYHATVNAVSTAIDSVISFAVNAGDAISNAYDNAKDYVLTKSQDIKQEVVDGYNTAKDIVDSIIDGTKQKVLDMYAALEQRLAELAVQKLLESQHQAELAAKKQLEDNAKIAAGYQTICTFGIFNCRLETDQEHKQRLDDEQKTKDGYQKVSCNIVGQSCRWETPDEKTKREQNYQQNCPLFANCTYFTDQQMKDAGYQRTQCDESICPWETDAQKHSRIEKADKDKEDAGYHKVGCNFLGLNCRWETDTEFKTRTEDEAKASLGYQKVCDTLAVFNCRWETDTEKADREKKERLAKITPTVAAEDKWESLTRKVKEQEKDDKGNPMLDNNGKPVFKEVDKEYKVKTIDVPYFNQCIKKDGDNWDPPECRRMCGAASAVMVAASQRKLTFDPKDENSLQKDMYTDNSQGINEVDMRAKDKNGNYIKKADGSYQYLYGYKVCKDPQGKPANIQGAFSITSSNDSCTENYFGGIENYLDYKDIQVASYIVKDAKYVELKTNEDIENAKKNKESIHTTLDQYQFDIIKNNIDQGKPVIMGMTSPDDHIFVVKGYTDDGGLVVNDSYKDSNIDTNYSTHGKDAVYYMNQPGQPVMGSYLIIK